MAASFKSTATRCSINKKSKHKRYWKMLTVQEIAQRLRVEHKTVRSLIKSGKLKAVRLGRSLRIREADYEQFLEEKLVKA